MHRLVPTLLILLALLPVGCGTAPPAPQPAPGSPAAAAGAAEHPGGKRGTAEHGMVSSAHPAASEAGVAMLRQGGNAVDAAVAAAFAIGVVEPMMSGLGGGGNLMVWRQEERRADHLDFYASAPAGIDPATADVRGHPARLVAVPGAVKGLLEAHERFGRLSREAVLAPAIDLAEDGFPVSPLLARTIAEDSALLTRTPRVRELFWPDMRPLGVGERLVQPELAATLRRVARLGSPGFYDGPVARAVLEAVGAGGNPMTAADLADYEPTWRRPVCGTFRGLTVLSAPPPQAGIQIIETLQILERERLADLGWPIASPEAFHTLAGALRLAIADRQTYLGFPDSVAVPAAGLTTGAYAGTRRLPLEAPRRVEPGDPWPYDDAPPAPGCAPYAPFAPAGADRATSAPDVPGAEPEADRPGETTHLSVVDADGNAVSLTITQGAYFGSGVWAAGTFLNNAMSIFSGNPASPNRLRPGARPASATAPTIILEPEGRVRMVIGSPGGGRIPPAVIQSIVYILAYGLDPLDALRMPRLQARYTTPLLDVEQGFAGDVLGDARARGYRLEVRPPLSLYFGGVHVIEWRDGRWVGAADPRRDGQVRGY